MIILAAAIILMLSGNGIILKSRQAKNETDDKSIEELATMGYSEALLKGYNTIEDLEREVLKYLQDVNADIEPYNIKVNRYGLSVTKKVTNPYDKNGWDIAYVSNGGVWNDTPIEKGNKAEGDIVAKIYKRNEILDMSTSGLPVANSNAYHIVIEGHGEIPSLSNVDVTPWIGHAWAKPALAWYMELTKNGITSLNPGIYPYISKVIICDGITNIGDDLCWMCVSLEEVIICEGVKSIGESVFENCTSLKSITIPSSITDISDSAFNNCPNLSDIYYGGDQKQWSEISIDNSDSLLTSSNIHYNSKMN